MPTAKIVLYKQKTLANGEHPVMLQIVHNSKVFRISIKYSCSLAQWDKGANQFKRGVENYKIKNTILRKTLLQAENIFDDIQKMDKPFSPALFKQLFIGIENKASFFAFTDELVQEFKLKGQISNHNIYKTVKNRVRTFYGKKKELLFTDIDVAFLKKFEAFLLSNGCTGGGAHHYMRTIRAIFNQAIERKLVEENFYPFTTSRNKSGYSLAKLKSAARPRAISIEDMDKIKNFDSKKYPKLKQSHLYFLFSYYARGINFYDMALLQWSNIYDGRLYYIRSKTKKEFNIPFSENLQKILDNFPKVDNDYIFPVLSDFHKTAQQQKDRIKKCRTKFNKDLKEIAKILNINVNLTSYVARHTFATTLKKKNVSIAKISQSLGHGDTRSTENYLKSFTNSELDIIDDLL